jgi:hypothetical protein
MHTVARIRIARAAPMEIAVSGLHVRHLSSRHGRRASRDSEEGCDGELDKFELHGRNGIGVWMWMLKV